MLLQNNAMDITCIIDLNVYSIFFPFKLDYYQIK